MSTKVIIIGAGWFGLVTAKTYLQVDPNIELTILEKARTVGGPWSRDRIYPTLTAQQPFGVMEYSDLSLNPDGEDPDSFIPADRLHAYLKQYAEKFFLLERTRLESEVYRVERAGAGWNVWVKTPGVGAGDSGPIYCDKLILATGLTSQPFIPEVQRKGFTPPVFHSQELGLRHDGVLASPEVKRVAVYGAGKSALDVVGTCVGLGKHVDWIIRERGSGAPALKPGRLFGVNSDTFVGSRYASKFHPSLFACEDGWYRFLHSGENRFGYWLHWAYWGLVSWISNKQFGYGTSENSEKLRPDILDRSIFWENTHSAILTRPEVLTAVHKGDLVTVHRSTITHLTDTTINLTNSKTSTNSTLHTDALIFATGWDITHPQFAPSLAAHLGLPTPRSLYPDHLADKWEALSKSASAKIDYLFPRLAVPPSTYTPPEETHTPFRLYNCILPPALAAENDRSFVRVGAVATAYTAIVSEVHALWAVAWMSGHLDLQLDTVEMERRVAEVGVWVGKRYLTAGVKVPYFLYDFLPMVDEMLRELGVESKRKKGAVEELFGLYRPTDYTGLVDEWKEIHGVCEARQGAL